MQPTFELAKLSSTTAGAWVSIEVAHVRRMSNSNGQRRLALARETFRGVKPRSRIRWPSQRDCLLFRERTI
jgi:hypothetical protein